MTKEDLTSIRQSWGWTQTGMANQLGLSLRAYQDIENGRAAIRGPLVLAVERLSLWVASETGDISKLLPGARADAERIAELMRPR